MTRERRSWLPPAIPTVHRGALLPGSSVSSGVDVDQLRCDMDKELESTTVKQINCDAEHVPEASVNTTDAGVNKSTIAWSRVEETIAFVSVGIFSGLVSQNIKHFAAESFLYR